MGHKEFIQLPDKKVSTAITKDGTILNFMNFMNSKKENIKIMSASTRLSDRVYYVKYKDIEDMDKK